MARRRKRYRKNPADGKTLLIVAGIVGIGYLVLRPRTAVAMPMGPAPVNTGDQITSGIIGSAAAILNSFGVGKPATPTTPSGGATQSLLNLFGAQNNPTAPNPNADGGLAPTDGLGSLG